MSTYTADGTPCVYISGENEKLGNILQCNASACRIFGYSKREQIIGHEVEVLMPKIYAKSHKRFIETLYKSPLTCYLIKKGWYLGNI